MKPSNQSRDWAESILQEVGKVIVGQRSLLERVLVGILSEGHLLLEGMPGLAKTLTIRTLAQVIRTQFRRIQFTPDLLPSDLIGTMVYNPKDLSFLPKKGPIFTNIVLADEINRAPAKVQSALLEAMGERQVTLGEVTYRLDDPFIVLATQNPLEQEGTYPLPEAQLDRFLFKIQVDYPTFDEEKIVLDRMSGLDLPVAQELISPEQLLEMRQLATQVYLDDKLKDYILRLIFATRDPSKYGVPVLSGKLQFGASPRATLAFGKSTRSLALLRGRDHVIPDDIKELAFDVLNHRMALQFDAAADEWSIHRVIHTLLDAVPVP